MSIKSNLDLASATDSFPYEDSSDVEHQRFLGDLWKVIWEDENGEYPIGYIPNRVLDELLKVPTRLKGEMDFNETKRTVLLFQYPTYDERTEKAASLAQHWKEKETFKVLKTWRDEPWPVYGRKGELLFSIERAAAGLLGVTRYGVHLTAFVRDSNAPYGVKLWTPRRALDKSTFPGMLDNTAAGGLTTGEVPFECIIREADEEASLPEEVVRKDAKDAGTITYVYISEEKHVGEDGLVYPEVQWNYDLELPDNIIPEPKDGEAQDFRLLNVDEVKKELAAGNFKHNCAVVVIDFFMRHGILTQENEPEIKEIERRIHRKIPFPGPHDPDWKPLGA